MAKRTTRRDRQCGVVDRHLPRPLCLPQTFPPYLPSMTMGQRSHSVPPSILSLSPLLIFLPTPSLLTSSPHLPSSTLLTTALLPSLVFLPSPSPPLLVSPSPPCLCSSSHRQPTLLAALPLRTFPSHLLFCLSFPFFPPLLDSPPYLPVKTKWAPYTLLPHPLTGRAQLPGYSAEESHATT